METNTASIINAAGSEGPASHQDTNVPSHTPTPWVVAGKTIRFRNLNTGPGVSICTMSNGVNAEYAAPNAAFIVRACNAHDELVAAFERILDGCRREGSLNSWVADVARAALAKAKGVDCA